MPINNALNGRYIIYAVWLKVHLGALSQYAVRPCIMRKRKDDRGVSLLSSSSPRNTLLAHMYQSLTNHSLFVSHFFSLGMKSGARKKRFACMLSYAKLSNASSVFLHFICQEHGVFLCSVFRRHFWQQCTAYFFAYFFLYLNCTLIYIDHISTTAMYRHIYNEIDGSDFRRLCDIIPSWCAQDHNVWQKCVLRPFYAQNYFPRDKNKLLYF